MPSNYTTIERCGSPHDTGFLRCESCRIWMRVYVRKSKARRKAGLPMQRRGDGLNLITLRRGQPLAPPSSLDLLAERAKSNLPLFGE